MPQETRPRIVPEQAQTPVSTGNPILDAVMQSAGSQPFNPNGGGVDVGSILQSIFNPPAAAPPPAPTWQDRLGGILNAIGNGVSVATSPDPGRVLSQQIGQRQQMQFEAQQQQKNADQRLREMQQQFGLQVVGQQLGEQADIRKEGRAEVRSAKERKAEEEARVRMFNLELSGKEKLQNIDYSNNLKLATIQNGWKNDSQKNLQDWQEHMADLERKDKRLYTQVDTALGLIKSGVDAGRATTIAKKWINDEALTKQEASAINAAVQKMQRAAAGGGGGGSAKDAWKMAQEFAKNPPYLLSDGSIVDSSGVGTDPISGQKVATGVSKDGQPLSIVRQLSNAESAQYAMQTVYPAAVGALTGKPIRGQSQPTQDGGVQSSAISVYSNFIKQARGQEKSDAEIKAALAARIKENPELKDYIEAAAVSQGLLEAPRQFKPKTDAEAKKIKAQKDEAAKQTKVQQVTGGGYARPF